MRDGRIGRRVRFFAAAAILIAVFSACAAGVYVIKSRTPEAEITIDGLTEDWKGALYLLADEQAFVGFMNDHDYLYVCLVSGDSRRPSQLMREGLTVWFDPAGGTKKVLGLRFPASTPPASREGAGARRGGEGARRPSPGAGPGPAEDEVEILRSKGPASERVALAQLANIGLELKADISGGAFTYELKIPLALSEKQPVAVGAAPGAAIGIGFETGTIRARAEGDDSGGEQGGGGRGGGMGGMGGMGGGRGGRGGMGGGRGGSGGTMNGPKPIDFWTEVRLVIAGKAAQASLLSVTEIFR